MIQIYELKHKAELFELAVQLFWTQWGTDANYSFYYDCMLHSMRTANDLPRFYIAVQNDCIVGTYALLRNDLISRQDLFPWFACLYVVPECRGQRMGAELLRHALGEAAKLGYGSLYLCTDLEGYYEKAGWFHLTNGYLLNGAETKIYTAASETNTASNERIEIQSITDCTESHRKTFAAYVAEEWPAVQHTVLSQLEQSLLAAAPLPLTFCMLKTGRMIGFYQLIEQEQLVRKDLSPWIAPIFISSSERGQSLGAALLQHARKTAGRLGYEKVYVTTDHIGYYEKYGFREIGLSNFEWGRPSKIYEHDTIGTRGTTG